MTSAQVDADVIVIGCGPAGAIAARELARRGLDVLMLDKSTFPRDKVCGCTLDAKAIATLERLGLQDALAALSPQAVTSVTLAARGRVATLPLRSTVAISRERFDAALLEAAIAAGCRVELGVHVRRVVHDGSSVRVEGHARDAYAVTARAVVAAGGLADRSLDADASIRDDARIGAAATLPADASPIACGQLVMAVGRRGYAGLVRLEDGRVRIAAALDAGAATHGLGSAIATILDDAGLASLPALATAAFRSTPPLTRSRDAVAEPGVFAVGDACGYVEPFSGEGMAWALRSAEIAAPFVAAAASGDAAAPVRYDAAWRHAIGDHRSVARRLQAWSRHPRLVSALLVAVRAAPRLARAWMPS